MRSPPGRVSRLFSHPGGRGAQGFPPHSPPLLTFLWPGGKRALPGARPALPAAAKFPGAGAGAGSASPGGLGCLGAAGDVPASLGREGAGGSPPSFGGFFPRGRRREAAPAPGEGLTVPGWSSIPGAGVCCCRNAKCWQVNV